MVLPIILQGRRIRGDWKDKMVIDPDPDEIYTKRKKRISSLPNNAPATSSVKYPSEGWGKSLERMPSFIGSSPDGRVFDFGCQNNFGLSEVKCPETKFHVTPLDACQDPNFFCEAVNGQCKLKRTHSYFAQVQGHMGVT